MKNKGISLITLVITIVVIIILTGAIVLSISNNNPINKASEAVAKSDVATLKEKWNVAYMTAVANNTGTAPTDAQVQNLFGTVPTGYSVSNSGIQYTGADPVRVQEAQSAGINTTSPDGVVIPAGFYYVTGTRTTGLVISNNILDQNNANGYNGDQFVWVPVSGNFSDAKALARRDWTGTGSAITISTVDGTGYYEPTSGDGNVIDGTNTSITKYGGFYIARFEGSLNGSNIGQSKAGVTPSASIKWSVAQSASESFDGGITSYNSWLVSGAQWDTALQWIMDTGKTKTSIADDSGTWANTAYSVSPANISGWGTIQNTGYSKNYGDVWAANRIHDLGGNTYEWSTEKYGTGSRVCRGGITVAGGFKMAARRGTADPEAAFLPLIGFRMSLTVN